jgi:hypothetical protein
MDKILFPLYVLIILSVSGCANNPSKSYYMDTKRGVVINSNESQHFKETITKCINQEKQNLYSPNKLKELCINKCGFRKLAPHEYAYIMIKK